MLDQAASSDRPRPAWLSWGFVVASSALAISLAALAYRLVRPPQSYSQFISGTLAFSAGSKTQDFALLVALLGGFLLVFCGLVAISNHLERRRDRAAALDFHSLTIYASLPLALWLGSLVLTETRSLAPAHITAALVSVVAGFSALAAWRERRDDGLAVLDSVGATLAAALFAMMSAVSLILALRRIGIVAGIDVLASHPGLTSAGALAAAAGAVVWLGIVWSPWSRDANDLERRLRATLLAAQSLTPLASFILLPTPWISGGRVFYGWPLRTSAVVVATLVLLMYADLLRRARRGGPLWSKISPLCLFAILLYFKIPTVDGPAIPSDDYHFGELLTPWWSWARHHLVPFWDFLPSRGLVNYVPGLLASVLFDGTAAAITAVWPLVSLLYLSISFPAIAAAIGLLPAFVGLLLMPPADTLSEIDVLTTTVVCVLGRGLGRWSPTRWLLTWSVLGVAGVLVAPGQGGLLILATSPLAAMMLVRAWRAEPARLARVAAVTALAAGVIAVATPLGRMLVGAVRYGAEQSSINAVAHGIPWSMTTPVAFANDLVWEAARASWLAVGAAAGVSLLAAWRAAPSRRTAALGYALPILLLSALYIVRAAGRIDPGTMSRLGVASIWMLGLCLPVALVTASERRAWPSVLFATLLGAGVILPFFPGPHVISIVGRVAETVAVNSAALTRGADIGLPNLGTAMVDPVHARRLTTIHRWLGRLLDPNETYLDLTNRNAQYFYFDRRPPIETTAVYNLVHERQQLRALRTLETIQPPVVLAWADTQAHDGGSTGLRSYLIYRAVVLNYIPITVDGLVLLVRSNRLDRLPVDLRTSADEGARWRGLDQAFGPASLGRLPVSWGASASTLEPQLRLVRRLDDAATPHDASVEAGAYRVRGAAPAVTFDLGPAGISGREAGMLDLTFACTGAAEARLEASWTADAVNGKLDFSAREGRMLVPLDASPRWLLADRVSTVRVAVVDHACTRFALRNVALWQRRVLGETGGARHQPPDVHRGEAVRPLGQRRDPGVVDDHELRSPRREGQVPEPTTSARAWDSDRRRS